MGETSDSDLIDIYMVYIYSIYVASSVVEQFLYQWIDLGSADRENKYPRKITPMTTDKSASEKLHCHMIQRS